MEMHSPFKRTHPPTRRHKTRVDGRVGVVSLGVVDDEEIRSMVFPVARAYVGLEEFSLEVRGWMKWFVV